MPVMRLEQEGKQLILHTEGAVCTTARDLMHSEVFEKVVALYCDELRRHESPFLDLFSGVREGEAAEAVTLLRVLAGSPLDEVVKFLPGAERFLEGRNRRLLHEFVEGLYDFWRHFERFMVLHSEPGPSSFDRRPYRSFNATLEELTHLARAVYRDICENITGDHPRIYRQVALGCNIGVIAVPKPCKLPPEYVDILGAVPFIRQVWMTPPLIIDPPTNRRAGQFRKVRSNPLRGLKLSRDEWLCYPAQVGPIVVFIYFHQRFVGLGCSLANLFELATDEQIARGPDAIYAFGVPPGAMSQFGDFPTVFFDDESCHLLVAAVPGEDRFAYFGYLKKMTLTLHNIVMMKRGKMPYHGAMVHISLKHGASANVVIVGDTGAGKSESLEAFRILARDHIRELRIIADDMGTLEVGPDGHLVGYGTETGAFIRLDDLQQGYAFEQISRAIIMSPQKINARVVLPVTTLDEVLHGYDVDFLLYANNYEQVDDDHPIIERFNAPEEALRVFREGAVMSKGTTTSTGLVHTYFGNIFGPPEYRELHEELAARSFGAAFRAGVYVGQMRTRLGIPGYESRGPEEAAKSLFDLIRSRQAADEAHKGLQP